MARSSSTTGGAQEDYLQMICLDILKDLLLRFGAELTAAQEELLSVLFPLLETPTESTRKRASLTVGMLVRDLADTQFQHLMELLIGRIEAPATEQEYLYTYIQTVGVIR
jgi:hypothetical protein